VIIDWQDGRRSEYPSIWLRDNCPEDRDPRNGQRLVDIADIPAHPRISAAVPDGTRVEVRWTGESRASLFELTWLATHVPGAPGTRIDSPRLWPDGAKLDAHRDFAWGAPPAKMQAFDDAYRAFAVELREPRYALRTRLDEGVLVVFDDRRTLHGRTAYASARHLRHLQGCYLTRDSVVSALGVLARASSAGAAS